MKIDKKYLPSEQFIARVVIIIIAIVFIFGIYELAKFIKSKITGESGPKSLMIKDLVQKDSNNNGYADWEESLWGLDPNKNGDENKKIIDSKKNALSPKDINNKNDSVSDNEMLAREFFATIMALQESGELNQESMQAVSNIVGEQIKASEIKDIYRNEDLKILANSETNMSTYYKSFKTLVASYKDKDIGKELSFIAQGLKDNDPQALYVAKEVAESYHSFGKDLMKMKVPEKLVKTHINLANDYEKTAVSIEGLSEMLNDPILAMRSIINYKKYSDNLVSDLGKLSEFFK